MDVNWTAPHYDELFTLNIQDFAKQAIKEIDEKIVGGIGYAPEDGEIIAQCVANCGNDDYLELGTLFGGSAILAAMTKKNWYFGGGVYCIDNLEMLGRTKKQIMDNAHTMGVEIDVKVSNTHPFPYPEREFGCVLIDAAHDFYNVWMDWNNVKKVATKYVIFHDYDRSHLDIMKAVKMAEWFPVHISHHTAVLERP